MGRETTCRGRIGKRAVEGRLLLETDELILRGDDRWKAPLKGLSASSDGDWLVVRNADGEARFEVGPKANAWAHAINHPRTRLDKLGVTADSRVLVVGIEDEELLEELRGRTGAVDDGGRAKGYDVVFLGVESTDDLRRVATLSRRIDAAGGVWLIHPKGRKDLSHDVLVAAGKAAGLIDNKTARISDTHTGLRFVIPKARR